MELVAAAAGEAAEEDEVDLGNSAGRINNCNRQRLMDLGSR